MLEGGTVALLKEVGVAERLCREGLVHASVELAVRGRRFRIDFHELTGKTVTVYGQTEVTKDLIAARLAGDRPIVWEASDVAIHDVGNRPTAADISGGRRRPAAGLLTSAAGCEARLS